MTLTTYIYYTHEHADVGTAYADTVVALSEARKFVYCSITEIVDSNLTRRIDVFPRLFCSCFVV